MYFVVYFKNSAFSRQEDIKELISQYGIEEIDRIELKNDNGNIIATFRI